MKLVLISLFLTGVLPLSGIAEDEKRTPAVPGQSAIYCQSETKNRSSEFRTSALHRAADLLNETLLATDQVEVVKKLDFFLGGKRMEYRVPVEYLVFKPSFSVSGPGIDVEDNYGQKDDPGLANARICVTLTQLEAPKPK